MAGRIVVILRVTNGRKDKKKFRIVKETIGRDGTVKQRKTLQDDIETEAKATARAEKLKVLL